MFPKLHPRLSLMAKKIKSWMRFSLCRPDYGGLPMEISTQIFDHPPDNNLLVTAAVSTAFNELSSEAHLFHNGVSHSSLREGTFVIESRVLAALQRSLFIPPIRRLSCTFSNPEGALHDLRVLEALLSTSPDVEELDISFSTATPPTGIRLDEAGKELPDPSKKASRSPTTDVTHSEPISSGERRTPFRSNAYLYKRRFSETAAHALPLGKNTVPEVQTIASGAHYHLK
ncbi:hypothetical protein C8R44DRAFT_745497 [Mycena epipterygia]|nr:hypothetical protein C8R44DRAFT_745497 [Mycena epipterygia]